MAGVEDVGDELNLADAPRIAVVGGGYAGMAAAVRISELGGSPIVFEAARVLGGRARRIDYREMRLDNGQHILSGAYRELLRLLDLVGVGAKAFERVPLNLQMPPEFGLRAPLLPAPLHTAVALFTARGLSWLDRFAAVRFMHALEANDWRVLPTQTVQLLLDSHRQSARLTDYLWRPLTVSALNTPIERASAQVFANVLRDALAGARECSDLLLPKIDMSALFPEPAARWITQRGGEVRMRQKVDTIHPTAHGVTIGGGDRNEPFAAAVLAVAPQQASAFPDLFSPNRPPDLEFEPITTIYLGYDAARGLALQPSMLGQARGLVHWFFDRRALYGDGDDEHLVVSAVLSASREAIELGNDVLTQRAHDELRRHLPKLRSPVWSKVVSEKFATFSCTPTVIRPGPQTASSRVFLAGDYVDNPYPATLESAVRNGVSAAELAMKALA